MFLFGTIVEVTMRKIQQFSTGVGVDIGVILASVLGARRFLSVGLYA
jgi:hypothetical protein